MFDSLLTVLMDYQHFGWLALLATVFFTPLAMRVALRYRVLDIPDQQLKPHARPIPYLGGTAICAGWTLALLFSLAATACAWQTLLPLLLGGLGMSVLGLVDDVRQVPPRLRLLIGAAIITGVILSTGAGLRLVGSLVSGLGLFVHDHGGELPAWFASVSLALALPASFVVSLVIVLGACNSTNLIDGLDGLSSGVTGIISLGFLLLAAHLAVLYPAAPGNSVRLVLAVAMAGASLGFLPWNFNPARIFMGDAGSMLLGYNCGLLILLFAEQGIIRWVFGALMIFALPVFDTLLAMVRRWRAGRSILEGDRSHFYDQLVQRGLSVRQTVLVCYVLAGVYTAIGLLVIFVRARYAFFIYVGVCLATALLAWASGLTAPEEPHRPRNRAD